MIVPTYFLTLLALLVASVFSAPIQVSSSGLTTFHPDHKQPSIAKSAHLIRGPRDHHLPVSEHHTLDLRSVYPDELEARSLESTVTLSQAKREEIPSDLARRSLWSKIKKGVSRAARGVARTVKKATHAVKNTVKKATHAVRKTVGRVVHTVKKAATWVKKNGAKIAKVGLKAVAAATKAASHVVAVIPGVGKAVGTALSNISRTADMVGSKIHVKLGGKWDKVMNVMDRIQHPLGHGTAAKVFDAVLKRDMEDAALIKRSLPELSVLYERDWQELDTRAINDLVERALQENPQLVARAMKYLEDA